MHRMQNQFNFSGDFSLIKAKVLYTEPAPGQYYDYNLDGYGTPVSAYMAIRPTDSSKFIIGLGMYVPFGSTIAYEDDWKGQYLLREMSLKTIFIQPTVAYSVSDKLGIGAGFVLATGEFGLRRGVPVQDSTGGYGEANLSGAAIGFGFNAGIHWQPNTKWALGLSYRSDVAAKVDEGNAEFDVAPSLEEYFPSTKFKAQISLPSVTNLGATYTHENLILSAEINYIGWKVYDSLVFDFEQNTDKLEDLRSPRHYENSFIFRLGGGYMINESMMVRGGAYYDMTPVQNGYLTPETPDANKIGLTAGFSYTFKNNLALHSALLYIDGAEREDTNLESTFSGTWKARAWSAGIGINYSF